MIISVPKPHLKWERIRRKVKIHSKDIQLEIMTMKME